MPSSPTFPMVRTVNMFGKVIGFVNCNVSWIVDGNDLSMDMIYWLICPKGYPLVNFLVYT